MPKRSSSPLIVGFFPVLLAGCGGAAAPPAERAAPPLSPPVAVAAPTAPTAAPPVASPPLAEPLPPLTRPFVSVTLPGVAGSLTAVDGRSPQDIWFLSDEEKKGTLVGPRPMGALVHYDGKRVVGRYMPSCSYGFVGISVGKDEVLMMGSNLWFRGVPPLFRASFERNGKKWSCSSPGYTTGLTVSSGDDVWKLDCDQDRGDCALQASRGASARLPAYDASFGAKGSGTSLSISNLRMLGPSDGWITIDDADGLSWLLRYNGVTWVRKAALDRELTPVDLWLDEAGQVWLTARRGGNEKDPANAVLRFDGSALQPLAVPASFATRLVRGTSAKDVWFIGAGRKVYQWDGQRLRQGEAPFAVGDAWSSPGGDVWIVGAGENGPGPGVVARTASLSEVR